MLYDMHGKVNSVPLRNVGFLVDQYGWKSDVPVNFQWKFPRSNFKRICPTIYALLPGHRQTDRHNLHIRPSLFTL
jgi:hypothetical protein